MVFAGYTYVATAAILAEIAVILWAFNRRPVWAIYAILLSIFLKGQYLWVGRPIYAWQIAALLGLVFLFTGRLRSTMLHPGAAIAGYRLSLQLFFVYSFLISIPLWMLFSAEGLGSVGTQVSASRVVSQTVFFSFLIGIFGIGLWAGRFLTAVNLLRTVILIATIVAYGAIVQFLLVRFVGINIFPVIGSDGTTRSAYIMQLVFRASSFAGEPKHLGILMSVGLIYCFLARLFRIPIGRRFAILKPLAMVTALLLSLSTTGFALTAAGIGVAATLFFRRLRLVDLAVVGIAVTVVVTQIIAAGGDFATSLLGQLNRMEIEVQDQSVVQGLLNAPMLLLTGTGLGNIHLFAVDFLPPEFPLFRDQGYKANSGVWFIIGDSGLIGLFLLLIGPLFCLQGYLQIRKYLSLDQRREALTMLAIVLMTTVSLLLRFDPLFFLISGFAVTRLAVVRTKAMGAMPARSHGKDLSRGSPKAVTT
ncbi:hypothetical protein [Pseudophaeobacter sp.]|uniref:hypothetical protein n=1 Tax=Pseudophaeobacter sp. TaxID=1971739 RepID=UPI003298C8DE